MILTRRGDYKPIVVGVRDRENCSPSSLTGWEFKLSLAYELGDTPLHTIVGTPLGKDGEVQFVLTPTETGKVGIYYMDVEATTAEGKKYTLLTDKVDIRGDITL